MLFIAELLAVLAAFLWLVILLLPWQPWRNNEVLPLPAAAGPGDLGDTTVVIPARDEARVIGQTLAALAGQGPGLRVLLVDDGSADGTSEVAQSVPGLNLGVISGQPLPEGWSGKVWALDQGVRRVQTPLTLMIDADVVLAPGVIAALKAQMRRGGYHFVSVMASLSMRSFWEKLLNPSFIYFFKMLYPFRLAKTANPRFYSAAGGCIMLETRIFQAIGGLASIRGELIDDCALARQVKRAHFRTWIGQSRAVRSLRAYHGLGDIWNMVARSAFTQLRYSFLILLLTTFFIVTLFLVPVASWAVPARQVQALGLLAWAMMAASYLPTLRFYSSSPLWALLLPLVGLLYAGMTWSSALRYWRGERSRWKGRVYR
ncbi:MAG: glycosyltransferase [Anaerolineae bacterium]|nr:glycosyltransferase [Anaerolineae bacterium]